MLGNLNGWHLVILIAIVVILFGAPRLPGLARSVGESMRIFRREVKTLGDESRADSEKASAAPVPSSSVPPVSTPDADVPAPARTE